MLIATIILHIIAIFTAGVTIGIVVGKRLSNG